MTDPTLFPDDRCTGCGQTPKGDGCWVCVPPFAGPIVKVNRACPDHPTIPRADCVCPYPGEESP